VLLANGEEHEAERVVAEIIGHRFVNQGQFSDYAVLYRGNHQARVVEQALIKSRIPYRISGGTSFFGRAEIKDVMAYLRLVVNPDDDAAFLRVVNVPRREIGPATLEKLGELAHAKGCSLFAAACEPELNGVIRSRPAAALEAAPVFMGLAVAGIVYGALVAMVQPDIKKLVAYSSVSHLGFVVLGLFAFTKASTDGALYQMLNHGISIGMLFFLVGVVYERRHTRQIRDYGGLASVVPVYAFFLIIATLASVGLPGTNGFVGEFSILYGSFISNIAHAKLLTGIAGTGVILGAVYMLWAVKRLFFGARGPALGHYEEESLDINGREMVVMAPLIILIFWMGVFPNDFLNWSKASLEHFVANRTHYELKLEE